MCEDSLVVVAVYGSLKSDGRLCNKEHIVCSREAKVNGILFNVPNGNFPFPGVKLGGDKEVTVEIQVVTHKYWEYMCFVESGLYDVVDVVVDGTPVKMFEWKQGYREEDVLPSGNWINR